LIAETICLSGDNAAATFRHRSRTWTAYS